MYVSLSGNQVLYICRTDQSYAGARILCHMDEDLKRRVEGVEGVEWNCLNKLG